MSHGDKITSLPPGFVSIGATDNTEYAACAGVLPGGSSPMYGVQFHPEVAHTPLGKDLLRNFVITVCGARTDWSMASFVEGELVAGERQSRKPHSTPLRAEAISSIRRTVGDGHVLGAVSGGVDSTVAAVLLHRAIGPRFHALMVDNGLLRKDEREQVVRRLRDECGVNLQAVDASGESMARSQLGPSSSPQTSPPPSLTL